MSPEKSMLLKTLQKQCNVENGRKALAIANKLAQARAANKQHVPHPQPDQDWEKSKPRSEKDTTSEDITSETETSAKGSGSSSSKKILDKVQDFPRKHPEAAAAIQKLVVELGKVALKR
ncbi:hypothetical protein E4U43_001187 [Claviceps pusilla]|uniref:Uncharacterized protein n=1 Tax=Claviceps pusilla TaxID=123648 RepID=A0A9P7N899_9HYPO|nr:hypothetical protein E4U43_001187 [Claviceps pusilla]